MRIVITVMAVLLQLTAAQSFADEGLKQKLSERLKKFLPDAQVSSISPSPISGLQEIMLGGDIVYMTDDGRYMFIKGDLVDLNERRNISEDHRGQARLTALKDAGMENMITFAPQNPKHFIYVFTDLDCGYCRKLHSEVAELNKGGIGVRYMAFPRAGIGSESYTKAVSVWCAKDKQTALTDAKNGKSITPASCDNPVKKQYELGQQMGVRGTPTIILEDGRELGGYVPSEQLIQYASGGSGKS
jgi:thiol:disulfide interchange protein DsbC